MLKKVSVPYLSQEGTIEAAKCIKWTNHRHERGHYYDSHWFNLTTSHNWYCTASVPWAYLTVGLRYQGSALALLVLKAGTPSLAYWWGGNTSILDMVCFSGSNLLMPLSALQSKRGSVTHQAVKTFFRTGSCLSIYPSPPNQRKVGHWIADCLLYCRCSSDPPSFMAVSPLPSRI